MQKLILTQNKVTLVDNTDYENLMKFNWRAILLNCGNWRAIRTGKQNGNQTIVIFIA